MNRISVSLLLFVLLIVIGIFGCIFFDRVCIDTENSLEEAILLAENGEYSAAASIVRNTAAVWEKKRSLLSLYINHGYLYEVSVRLGGLDKMSTEEAVDEFLSGAKQAIVTLRRVKSDK